MLDTRRLKIHVSNWRKSEKYIKGLSYIFKDRGRSPKPANPSEDVKPQTQDNETILDWSIWERPKSITDHSERIQSAHCLIWWSPNSNPPVKTHFMHSWGLMSLVSYEQCCGTIFQYCTVLCWCILPINLLPALQSDPTVTQFFNTFPKCDVSVDCPLDSPSLCSCHSSLLAV